MQGRLCPACGAVEAVTRDAPIWPIGVPCNLCNYEVPHRHDIPMFCPELADTADGFDPKIFDVLASVEDHHFWFVARNRFILGLISKYFSSAKSFLEIGCGNGAVLSAVSSLKKWDHLVGSELHPAGLKFAKDRLPNATEFVQMDARNIPAVGVFDLTGAFDVIEHIADDEGVLRGLRRATKLGGGAIIAVPQHPWLWSRSDEVAHHERRYRRGELEAKLTRNGFEVVFSSSFMAFLLPVMLISRLNDGGKNKNEAMDREFSINPTLNRIFKQIMFGEIWLTLSGVRWPAGGSRIVVARAV